MRCELARRRHRSRTCRQPEKTRATSPTGRSRAVSLASYTCRRRRAHSPHGQKHHAAWAQKRRWRRQWQHAAARQTDPARRCCTQSPSPHSRRTTPLRISHAAHLRVGSMIPILCTASPLGSSPQRTQDQCLHPQMTPQRCRSGRCTLHRGAARRSSMCESPTGRHSTQRALCRAAAPATAPALPHPQPPCRARAPLTCAWVGDGGKAAGGALGHVDDWAPQAADGAAEGALQVQGVGVGVEGVAGDGAVGADDGRAGHNVDGERASRAAALAGQAVAVLTDLEGLRAHAAVGVSRPRRRVEHVRDVRALHLTPGEGLQQVDLQGGLW